MSSRGTYYSPLPTRSDTYPFTSSHSAPSFSEGSASDSGVSFSGSRGRHSPNSNCSSCLSRRRRCRPGSNTRRFRRAVRMGLPVPSGCRYLTQVQFNRLLQEAPFILELERELRSLSLTMDSFRSFCAEFGSPRAGYTLQRI